MNKKQLINSFSKCLVDKRGALFAGSGISYSSTNFDWVKLVNELAADTMIKADKNDDLPQLMQYIINENNDNRGPIIDRMRNLLLKDFKLNEYHKSLQLMNISTIWTTNYDTLLEKTFKNTKCIVKHCDGDMTHAVTSNNIEIIKIHGCIEKSDPKDIIITKEDYEDFSRNRPITVQRFCNDIIEKSFLFIGYSYNDENIRQILALARYLTPKSTGQHYLILRKEAENNKQKQELWINDLKRYGIGTVLIENYSELNEILVEIARKSRGNNLFVTGSHKTNTGFAKKLGELLAQEENITLLNGQSEGIGQEVLSGFVNASISKQLEFSNRLKLFPNPYAFNPDYEDKDELIPELKKARLNIFREAQIVVVFPGGKGTIAEMDLASEHKCIIIPVYDPETNDVNVYNDFIKKEYVSPFISRDKDYYNKLVQKKLKPEDVIECIRKTMN